MLDWLRLPSYFVSTHFKSHLFVCLFLLHATHINLYFMISICQIASGLLGAYHAEFQLWTLLKQLCIIHTSS